MLSNHKKFICFSIATLIHSNKCSTKTLSYSAQFRYIYVRIYYTRRSRARRRLPNVDPRGREPRRSNSILSLFFRLAFFAILLPVLIYIYRSLGQACCVYIYIPQIDGEKSSSKRIYTFGHAAERVSDPPDVLFNAFILL